MSRVLLISLFLVFTGLLLSADFFINSAEQPYIIGDFNNWKPVTMEKAAGNWWYASIELDPGIYHYYFTTENGKRIIDPFKERIAGDTGPLNILRVQGPVSPHGLSERDIVHRIWEREYFNPVKPGEYYITISVIEDLTNSVFIVLNGKRVKMNFLRSSGGYDYFRVNLKNVQALEYYFELSVDESKLYFGANGLSEHDIISFSLPLEDLPVEYFDTPEWSKGAVYYQIFPERFANGDSANDPMGSQDWYADPKKSNLGSDGFFGGDLQGVLKHLDYLEKLGIDAIYFNPIFESVSSHKYDTVDYLKIDDNFGDYELFKKLVGELDRKGISVILDGVFNHTGDEFWAFQDIKEKGKESPYWDWYFIKGDKPRKYKGHALNYIAWGGYADMPKLNVLNPEVVSYINKVLEKYAMAGIKGWRLDVAGEVNPAFWRLYFRPTVKGLNKESLIVGEIWGDARVYLQGDLFDSVMNYQFRDAVIEYVARAGHSAKKFVAMTDYYLKRYPPQVLYSLWNMLDSHDTERFLTTVYGNEKLFKIAVGLQMTFLGSPVIYYGDEVGMEGGKDPDNRRPMPWKEELWDIEILDYYKKLISLRREHPALRTGSYEVVQTQNSLLVYRRKLDDDEILVIVNPGSEAELLHDLSGSYEELLTGKIIELEKLTIPPESFMIFTPNKKSTR
ncbi:alpha-amylase family glycosyl hydrolase [Kosmotoga pacifica]|uniref:Alpha-amylase n=1 Tax=Kosmotoga pacifica TaxID=1330330 RepID=A0A0G2Z6T0_9BACT|nr:alpha-amylase family glycosyl hydrolase [Kosmotoga pacifica]AKI97267.1 alpha-amylase [Kosmotoga pacifica]